MTHDGKQVDEGALDEAALADVARAYEAAGFRETSPPQVDSAILNRAARESQRSRRRFAFKPAYLAWAAVVALSLSVVLELAVRTPQAPTLGVESSRRAAESGPGLRRANEMPVEEAGGNSAESGAARTFAFGGDREAAQRGFEEGAGPGSPNGTANESAARTGAESTADASTPDFEPAARRAAEPSRALTAAPAATGCAEQDRATPESWLACIDALNGNAAEEIFAAELAAFRALHPNHVLPRGLVRDRR